MFLVFGITGRVGGAAARQLLSEGRKVRAMVRDPQKASAWAAKGVEVRKGDFNDAAALVDALKDVEGAYVMMPPVMAPAPGFPEAKAFIASYVEALKKSPVPRLVVLSSIGSEQTSKLGLITQTHMLEAALSGMAFPTAFVRAGGFVENLLPGLKTAAESGVFDTFLTPTDRKVPTIATEDIGKEVARLLTGSWTGKKIVELGSPVSPDDLAGAMSEVLGRPVKARVVPREHWAASLEAMGIPRGRTIGFEEMEESFNSGWIHFGVEGTEAVAATITPAQVFGSYGSS
jgi:uncharacterized protein YbjT (DUF2867 family)